MTQEKFIGGLSC